MSKDNKNEVKTTGHVWDGNLEEYNNPLPRWWLWILYICIVWAIWYSVAYPAWPVSKEGATAGYLGFSTRGDVAAEIDKFTEMNAALETELASADLTTISDNAPLFNYAKQSGAAVFNTWCSQCRVLALGAPDTFGWHIVSPPLASSRPSRPFGRPSKKCPEIRGRPLIVGNIRVF